MMEKKKKHFDIVQKIIFWITFANIFLLQLPNTTQMNTYGSRLIPIPPD
jgi:hypothetical protein